MNIIPPTRGRDAQGAGYFGASRGSRRHNGVDFVAMPGERVTAFTGGTVTKLGFAYADKPEFRYVEVTDVSGLKVRYFYVEPRVAVGDSVAIGHELGVCQRLPYPGITQHFHFEVKRGDEYLDPIKYLCGDVT